MAISPRLEPSLGTRFLTSQDLVPAKLRISQKLVISPMDIFCWGVDNNRPWFPVNICSVKRIKPKTTHGTDNDKNIANEVAQNDSYSGIYSKQCFYYSTILV